MPPDQKRRPLTRVRFPGRVGPMAARSGQAYVESLKKNAPCVYLGGRRVIDVTEEPTFQEPMRAVAEQYDMQLDPRYRDVMTYRSPTGGDPVSTSFLVPYTREDLVKKRQHFKLRATTTSASWAGPPTS